jgi:hypothetical protein
MSRKSEQLEHLRQRLRVNLGSVLTCQVKTQELLKSQHHNVKKSKQLEHLRQTLRVILGSVSTCQDKNRELHKGQHHYVKKI